MNAQNGNGTLHSEIDERYQAVGGFVCFCLNFCTLFYWRCLHRDPVFPILLNLCVANALKTSVNYVSGLQAVFLRYFHQYSYPGALDPARSWTHVWMFFGHQAVCWSTLGLAFDRFVAAAHPDQYAHTRKLYQAGVVVCSWTLATGAWLSALVYSKRGHVNVWYELTIVRSETTAVIGFFRCLNVAGAISCFIFLLSTVIVYARRVNEIRKRKKKWSNALTMSVGPRRKTAVVSRVPSRPLILVNQISLEKTDKTGGWAFDLVPALVSWHFNGILWLVPAVVSLVQTASGDTLTFSASTILILSLLQSFHGSVDVLVHTFKAGSKRKKFLCCGGHPRSRRTSSSVALVTGTSITITNSYQACSSTGNGGNTSCMYMDEFTIMEEGSVELD